MNNPEEINYVMTVITLFSLLIAGAFMAALHDLRQENKELRRYIAKHGNHPSSVSSAQPLTLITDSEDDF